VPGRADGVPAGVVTLEELLRVGERGAFQVLERAIAVVRVRERAEHHRWQPQPGEPAVGPVEDVDADLLLHHVHLVAQRLLGHPGAAHAVGLEEQRALQGAGRQHLEVVGVVQVGGAVEAPPGPLHVAEVGELLQVFRTLEHQMLEEVGEPGPALRLTADAHVVDDRHTDDRCAAIGREDHPQTVVEGEPFDRVLGRGDLLLSRHATNIT
jgi:hypothetical protein